MISQRESYETVVNNKKIAYYNIPAAFDIETTSFYENGIVQPENKRAIMYIWQFGINNIVCYGRTWEEFINLLKVVRVALNLVNCNRLVIYVHNLPYEFQFMRKLFDWDSVFVPDERRPIYALTNGLEFRCSLKLAGGKSLADVGKDLTKYKVDKLVGDLDYDVLRTPLTPVTTRELGYCENDIRVILSYIQEKIEQDGSILNIPLTNTGYVREYCRKNCYKRWIKYRNIITNLTMTVDDYSQLKRTFMGGFTHANANYVEKVLTDLRSFDFTSSYPAAMVLEKYPMSKSMSITNGIGQDEMFHYLINYCCMFDVDIYNMIPKRHQEHPLSVSKCVIAEKVVADNGRVVTASHIRTSITEQDYFTFREFYEWDKLEVSNFKYYVKNYLPTPFVKSILSLYGDKTRLKGVVGEEVNYMIKKGMANASYGMIVTDPVREEIEYDNNEYIKVAGNVEKAIDIYNNSIKRFLYYPWGLWVTAYARANLFSGIIELGDDYVYSDTDSLKLLNYDKHKDYFENYNSGIMLKIQEAAKHHNISEEYFSPLNLKGEAKTIGLWDDEGVIDEFKTLGAKRYLMRTGDKWTLTLAGANKKKSMQALLDSGDPFKTFDNGWVIDKEHSGRLTMTYIDDPTDGWLVDCNGVPYHYHEESSVHAEKSEYKLSLSDEFERYLRGFTEIVTKD